MAVGRIIVASHGRNPENRNERASRGKGMVQMLDACFSHGKSFNLSTVSKDNYLLEYEVRISTTHGRKDP